MPPGDTKEELHQVEFEPCGRRGPCPKGATLLECAQQLGVALATDCAGQGICGSCRVRAASGDLSAPTDAEVEAFDRGELAAGWRLACQARIEGPCRVQVPESSSATVQRIQVEGGDAAVEPQPAVRALVFAAKPPSLSDPRSDLENILGALNESGPPAASRVDLELLRILPDRIRQLQYRGVAIVRDGELIALGSRSSRMLGAAFDLGSTKIAGYLVDLDSGELLSSAGVMNPQICQGEDIISRIRYAAGGAEARERLQRDVATAISELAAALCEQAGAVTEDIVDAVVAGNTAMHHLFLGLPVRQLGRAPYVPALRTALDIKAREVGLPFARGAGLHCFANVAGFVGGDHLAMLLATEELWRDRVAIALDIGTNTEISVISDGEITSASCASGPAFEAFHIQDGVRATEGAIDHVSIRKDQVCLHTIGSAGPIGICGSGVLDATAQLRQAGVLDRGGRMQPDSHPRLREHDGVRELVLVPADDNAGRPALRFSQKDVREVQLGKAAIQAAVQVLLQERGIQVQDVERVIVAGAFGSYLDLDSCMAIGLLPALPRERFSQVGNAAGTGCRLALISRGCREREEELVEQVRYLELADSADFKRAFLEACSIAPFGPLAQTGKEDEHGNANSSR